MHVQGNNPQWSDQFLILKSAGANEILWYINDIAEDPWLEYLNMPRDGLKVQFATINTDSRKGSAVSGDTIVNFMFDAGQITFKSTASSSLKAILNDGFITLSTGN